MADSLAAFSRTANSSPFGKCTEELKCKLPYEVKESFSRLAHELGVTESELLRDMVMTRLFSAEHLVSLYAKRLAGVAGIGQEKAPNQQQMPHQIPVGY